MLKGEGRRVRRERQILIGVLGIALVGAVVGEHSYRRRIERRYHEAIAARQQLELQFGEVLASQGELKRSLKTERQRTHDLSEALASTRGQFEEAVGRLAEETRALRTLQMRFAAMHD